MNLDRAGGGGGATTWRFHRRGALQLEKSLRDNSFRSEADDFL